MIQHAHLSSLCQCVRHKAPIIVLSDNYWLYFGVSQLYPHSKVIHVRFLDEALYRKLWGNADSVILIIDNDIFIQGEWLSMLGMFEVCTFLKIIWLKGDKTGAFIPVDHAKSFLVEKKKALFEFERDLNDIFCGQELRIAKSPCTSLTKKERYMIKYLAADQDIQTISERACLSLKSVYHVRSTLMSKLGFDNAYFFQLILFKNIDILFPFFTNRTHAFHVQQRQ
ncbi:MULTISPECIES: LuxR C-terminal-related transcriptional regulator [Pantoea]|uniref:LuxR C-terminal-related transcriptional regulator n=1 Tax=Pantoea TaxID=53335 RepID=UPI001F4DA85D|nr:MULTISPECIES: LuxR C-terminal-related transcriptional regulator [Pantoea]MCH9297450.1 LuxR C-terminal-related transcriptional regulator [Pantoea allii]